MKPNNTLIINAYPLRFSGALQILRQFIRGIEQYSNPKDFYYVFIDASVKIETVAKNIEFIPVKQNIIAKRLFFINFFGIKRYLKRRKLKADKIVSLANINTSLGNGIEEYVYFHQPLTIYRYKWNIFNKLERMNAYYKHIYKWVIQRSLTDQTVVIAQLDCIVDRCAEVFGVDSSRFIKVTPNVAIPEVKTVELPVKIDDDTVNMIYPATPVSYKNHRTIIDALRLIPKDGDRKYRLYLTCSVEELAHIGIAGFTNNVEIVCMGHISFDQLMLLYTKMDALLFPSYIESFGLPMIEAATTGVQIVAADTDFANEVLKGYDGVTFVPPFDTNKWCEEIMKIAKAKRFNPLEIATTDSWKLLFDKLNK